MHDELNVRVFMNAQHTNVKISLRLNTASITTATCRSSRLRSSVDTLAPWLQRPRMVEQR